MITRLVVGALVLGLTACTTPAAEAPAAEAWECRDAVRNAAVRAYALARFRDDQRAVILLPAGKAAAEYEAETKRLRDEGARLMAVLKANDPASDALPPPPAIEPASVTEEMAAAAIGEAYACVAKAAG